MLFSENLRRFNDKIIFNYAHFVNYLVIRRAFPAKQMFKKYNIIVFV
jgi:hypothetical protein